jgi:O-antigen/teichoic acid export membrane protein
MKEANLLTAFSAFMAMAVASLMACATSMWLLRDLWRKQKGGEVRVTEMAASHWGYGRWALCTAVVQWLPGNIYFALLPRWMDLEGAGALRALMNVAMPVLQAITALSMLLLPSLVRQRKAGPTQVTRTMMSYVLLFLCGASAYAVLIWVFKKQVFQFVYVGKYSAFTGLPLILATLLPFGSTFTAVLANGLRALEYPNRLFWCYLASSASALVVGLPLTSMHGVTGALIGIHISSVLTIAIMLMLYRNSLRQAFCLNAPKERAER